MMDLTKLVKERGDSPPAVVPAESRPEKAMPPRKRKQSTMGQVSCAMAAAAVVLALIGVPAKQAVGSLSAAIVVILICIVTGLCVVGMVSGAMGLMSKRRSALMPIVGMVVNPMVGIAFGIYLWWPMPQTLVTAAENDDVEQIQRAASMGVDVNAEAWFDDHDGTRLRGTGLVAAALKGRQQAVLTLLAMQAKVNEADSKGRTALFHAASQGYGDMVKQLLDAGANPNINPEGAPALYLAARQGNQQIVQALLKHRAEVNVPGYPPLIPAAAAGHTKIVEMLLEKGAQVNTADEDGMTALHAASVSGYQYVVRMLLRNKADPSLRNRFGETPLELAINGKHEQVVQDLLNVGSPIDIFAAIGLNDMEKVISEVDRDPSLLTKTRRSLTLLHLAARHGRTEITRFLLERGAAIDARTEVDRGATPLYLAIINGHEDVVSILLEKEADPNLEIVVEEGGGKTVGPALYFAVAAGNLDIVDDLINAGADVNTQCTTEGVDGPPLLYAVKHKHHEVAQRLIDAKANVNFRKNNNSPTPLFEAVKNVDDKMVELLLRGGADVKAKLNNRTPLDVVRLEQRGNANVETYARIELLLKAAEGTDEHGKR